MKPLIGETLRVVFSRPGPLALIALITAVSCATVILTTGRSAAAEVEVLNRLDLLGTRVVTIADNNQMAHIDPQSVRVLSSATGIEWALGLGPAVEVKNVHTQTTAKPVSAREVRGDVSEALTLLNGRWPHPGEAIAAAGAAQSLGFVDGSGRIVLPSGETLGVVGVYAPNTNLTGFEDLVLVSPSLAEERSPQLFLYVSAASLDGIDEIAASIPQLLIVQNRTAVTVEIADSLTNARKQIAGDLAGNSRFLMLVTLGIGVVVVMLTLFAASNERKRDFGRRRALGASRSALTGMVLTQALIASSGGAVSGITGAVLYASTALSTEIPLAFAFGVGVLSILAASVASLPPAFRVAFSDPARVLRVP